MTKFQRTLTALGLISAMAAPGLVLASVAVGDRLGVTDDEIRAALEAQGYTVIEIEREGDEIEVEVSGPDGLFEFELAADSGILIEMEPEEAEDDDNGEDGDDDQN